MDFQYCEIITRDKCVGKMCVSSLHQVAVFNTVKEKEDSKYASRKLSVYKSRKHSFATKRRYN
jgi:hypothetical protein